MRAHLVLIEAQDSAGAVVPIRLSSVDDRRLCHLGGMAWYPAIAKLPTLAYDFFGGDFSGRIAAPAGTLSIAIDGLPEFGSARFAGARVRIWEGELGGRWTDYVLRFDGRVTAEPSVESGLASIGIGPDDAWLDKPLLTSFKGTGGIEGPDDLEGTPKPLLLGACRFAPGTLVDAVDLVYCLSGYGPIAAVNAVYDRVASLGASSGNYADLAALLAATVPAGSWATCLARGLVRLGAPADGQVSFAVSGDTADGFVRRPGALIGRIAALAGGTVDPSNLAALDAARPWNLAYLLTAQTTAREAIQQIADSVCAVAGVGLTGKLFVAPLGFTSASLTLDADGRAEPPVADVSCEVIAEPYWRLATNAEISWVVHDPADVATGYVYRGEWKAERVYRLDDLVETDGVKAWVYIADVPSAGTVPGTDGAVWRQERAGTYADGTSIDDLQPDEGGAQITRNIALSESTVLVTVDAAGAPIGGQLPRTVQATFSEANYDVTLATSWAIFPAPGITASIDDTPGSMTRGRVTITGMTAAGSITVTATRGNVVATASIAVVAKGVLSDLNQADTGNLTDNAATVIASFFKSFTTTVGAAGTWMPVDDGSDAATVTVATGSKNVQQIFIDAYMGVRRAGSSNDIIEYRVRRDDGVILPQVWDVEATNDKAIMAFAFLDANPSENVTHTYALQMKSDDASTPIYEVFLKALLGKTG